MRVFYAFLILAFLSVDSIAQKKPLDHTVYDSWQNISTTAISKKGEYIFYSVSPQEGDDQLFLKTNRNETVFTLPRASKPQFSFDEKHFVSLVSPLFKDTRQAKIDKKKKDEMPKDSLAIYSFATKSWVKFPNVKSYKLAEENGKYALYLYDDIPAKKPKKDTLESKSPKETASTDSSKVKKEKPKKPTTDLVIYQLGVGKDTVFKNVEDYEIDKLGNQVVFSRKPEEKDSTGITGGVFRYDLKTKQLVHLTSGKGTFKNFTFDESGKQLAFLADKSAEKALLKEYKIYYHTESSTDSAKVLVSADTKGVPQKWYVSGDGDLKFSKKGNRLFLGLAPIPRVKDTTLVEFENAKVDIWHWQDDYLQTQQLVNLKRDLSKNYLAVLDLNTPDKVLPLADESLPDTRTTEGLDEEFILATTDIGRRIETQWQTGSFQDVYLVSTNDGSRKLVTKDLRGNIILSPEGKYLLWYNRENQNWYSHNVATGTTVQLNKDLAVSFADEDNDSPDTPGSYGVSGWTANDDKVYIYDKFDIWSFKTDGTQAVKLTSGRDSKTTYRYSDWVERKGRFAPTLIDEKKPLILSTFNNVSKENGFAKLTLQTGKKAPKEPFKEIVLAKTFYGQIKEAKDGGAYIYSKESYADSPDLYFSKDFVTETKLSSINPQQANFNWGTAELYKWTTPKGHAAEGILYKPEDFNPNKTYPIIAYFYEKLSDGLYRYQAPAPTPSRLNISYFVSNGYVVLAPDIVYEIGYPGKSAEEYINSGMAELKKNKWAGKLAIQGQSWGGYQVAHLITVTNMYDAAWTGAPVVNMTSAYGGIRWQTGMNRQFQYERTQSRIGATLWEKPELYIENSPLFSLPKVTTPVVIMHNDEDGAVPWYQGIEMFTALRRLQKPVWMLNYNGDAHNLVQRQNRKDIQRRQQQFFDHYLKGKPAAPWIEKGVPATLKGIDWGFGE